MRRTGCGLQAQHGREAADRAAKTALLLLVAVSSASAARVVQAEPQGIICPRLVNRQSSELEPQAETP